MRDERRKQAFANISNSFLLFYQHKVSSQALFLPLLFQFHLCDEDKLHVFIPIKVSEIKLQQSPDLVTVDLVKNLDLVKFSLLTEFL